MITKPLVFIAYPIGQTDQIGNARIAYQFANRLIAEGTVTPVVPVNLSWHMCAPPPSWTSYDFDLLCHCDALYRMPGASPGADAEVRLAQEEGKPVFTNLEALYIWARTWLEKLP